MEISPNGAVNAALAQQNVNTQQNVQVSMLKKAIDVQSEGALALINSLPTAPTTQGLPGNVGKNINKTA